MSQEYTEDKEVTLKRLSSGRRLLEAVLIVVAIFAVYLMAALVSFNPSDPSWSQTAWHEPIHNLGGGVGAWLADTLFFTFGVLAYAIPPIMLVCAGRPIASAATETTSTISRSPAPDRHPGVSAYLLWVGGAER